MGDINIASIVDTAIAKWWQTFTGRLTKVKQAGMVPVIVALSRKMPRLIEWMVTTYLPAYPELPDANAFAGCELTTELSIPFRVAVARGVSRECYILLDDIIIHGSTIRNVVNDIEMLCGVDMYGHDRCYISTIFVYRRPALESTFASTEDISDIDPLDKTGVLGVVRELATRLRDTSLPLDMEFPLLRIPGSHLAEDGVNEVYGHFAAIHGSCAHEPYPGRWGNSVTLPLAGDSALAADFAKVRYFASAAGASFAVFMPYILPDYLNESHNIEVFRNPLYALMWESVARPVVDFVRSAPRLLYSSNGAALYRDISRSLVVWLNYLLSLSYFACNKHWIVPPSMADCIGIKAEDIYLILGKTCGDSVLSMIRRAVDGGIDGEPKLPSVHGVTDHFAPKPFEAMYVMKKARLAARSSSVDEVMNGIFAFQNFSNPDYARPQYRYERLFYGETFGSLAKACLPYFKGPEVMTEISRWVDDQIDNGVVVPKYEVCHTPEGYVRWRRFFHAGLNYPEVSEAINR